jgi:hypothetical protein
MPATSASIGGGRGERQIPFVVVRRHRARMGVAHDVGPPRVGHALHRAGHYRDAEAAGRGDRALDVVDGRLELQGTKHPMGHVSILEAHDRVADRAEQRLDHDVAGPRTWASLPSPTLDRSRVAGIASTSWRRVASVPISPRECQEPDAPRTATRIRAVTG